MPLYSCSKFLQERLARGYRKWIVERDAWHFLKCDYPQRLLQISMKYSHHSLIQDFAEQEVFVVELPISIASSY